MKDFEIFNNEKIVKQFEYSKILKLYDNVYTSYDSSVSIRLDYTHFWDPLKDVQYKAHYYITKDKKRICPIFVDDIDGFMNINKLMARIDMGLNQNPLYPSTQIVTIDKKNKCVHYIATKIPNKDFDL